MKTNIDLKKVVVFIAVIICLIFIVNIIFKNNNRFIVEEKKEYKLNYLVEYTIDGTVGVIDKEGKEIINPEYIDVYIPNPEKDVFICIKDDTNYDVLNSKGEKILTDYEKVWPLVTSDGIGYYEKELLRFENSGKYGLIDFEGNVKLKADYDEIVSLKYKAGKFLLKKGNKYGVSDSEGNIIIDFDYEAIEGDGFCTEKEGYTKTGYIVKQKTNSGIMTGYIDCFGREILKPSYESIERVFNYKDLDNVYLIEMQNGKKGVFKNDKKIIENDYQLISYSDTSDIFVAKTSSYYLFFKTDGRKVINGKFDSYSLAGNYLAVNENDEKKLYDLNGNFITKTDYKEIQKTDNENYLITIDNDNHYSIMNKNFNMNNDYINLSYAFDDYFIFTTEDSKVGVLDVWNGVVIQPEYDYILNIDKINALEAKKGEETVIFSRNLEKVSTMSGAIVENYNDKYAIIYSDNEMIYLDENGNIISNTKVLDNELYAIKQAGKWGFCDRSSNIVVECKYDIVTEFNEYGFAGIKKDGKWGVVDIKGNIVLEPEFEIETYYFPKFIGKTYLEQTDTFHCIKLK